MNYACLSGTKRVGQQHLALSVCRLHVRCVSDRNASPWIRFVLPNTVATVFALHPSARVPRNVNKLCRIETAGVNERVGGRGKNSKVRSLNRSHQCRHCLSAVGNGEEYQSSGSPYSATSFASLTLTHFPSRTLCSSFQFGLIPASM